MQFGFLQPILKTVKTNITISLEINLDNLRNQKNILELKICDKTSDHDQTA